MRTNKGKMDKMRNAVMRNAKMQMQSQSEAYEPNEIGSNMNDNEAAESPRTQRREMQSPKGRMNYKGKGWKC